MSNYDWYYEELLELDKNLDEGIITGTEHKIYLDELNDDYEAQTEIERSSYYDSLGF